jgi:hypothetical protein
MWLARQSEQSSALQEQLKESNALIEQLIQELKERGGPDHHQARWYLGQFKKNRKREE